MNKERLGILANHLRTVAPDQFGLSTWECGTVACAVGHATRLPEFAALGFRMSPDWFCSTTPALHAHHGWPAVELLFDLDRGDAEYLFADWSYPDNAKGADNVADPIEEFVRGAA